MQLPTEFLQQIENKPASERKEIILNLLNDISGYSQFAVKIQEFEYKKEIRTNIIASFTGKSEEKHVVGAHYDIWPNSGGMNDNGAAVFILLKLIENISSFSLLNTSIDFVFFDMEEKHQTGAKEFLTQESSTILSMINLDMCGIGDYVVFNQTSEDFPALSTKMTHYCEKNSLNYKILPMMPPGDDIPFRNQNINAISIAIIPQIAIPVVERLAYITNSKGLKWKKLTESVKFMFDMIKGVPMLNTMHSSADTIDTISVKSIDTVYSVTLQLVKSLIQNKEK